jgi:nucleotide-binding universal stress UspA family protein
MYKKIMVAVDGSETGKQAVVEAENIANTYNATLCIVHSVGGDTEADKNTGTEILEQAKSSVSALNVETRLLEAEMEYGLNGITEAIAKATADWGADLLVVGTSNRRGLERFFVGSVAEQLVAKVDASILLVRPQ